MNPLNPDYNTFYKQAFMQSPIGMALATGEGQWVQVNPALCALLGYREQELLSLSARSLLPAGDDVRFDHCVRQAFVPEESAGQSIGQTAEIHCLSRSGEAIAVSLTMSPLLDEEGSPVMLSMIFLERKAEMPSAGDDFLTEDRQRTILEHAIDIITCNSPTGICEYVSPSVRSLLGYEPEEMIGRHQFEIFHPDDVQAVAARQFEDIDKFTCRVLHKDGRYVWFETTLKFIRDELGGVQKIIGVGRDITERTLTEQALIRSEKKLAEAQNIASIGSWEWDILSDEVVWSEQFLRVFDLHSAPLSGRQILLPQYVHPEDKDLLQDSIRRALEGEPYNLECRIISAAGIEKHVHTQGIVMFDEQGKAERMVGTLQDITERKKMLQQLEESADRYMSLKKYSSDAIISLDLDGYITSVNPAAEKISGYLTEELLAMHFSELVYPADLAEADAKFRLLIQGNAQDSYEMRIHHKDGAVLDLVITPAPIIIRQQLAGCYVLVKDVTVQKKKDEFLRNSEKLSVVGQLAAGVAHEIRNPLTALKGFIKLMKNADHQIPKYLLIMNDELERIELIVSELLMLSRPQSVQLRPVHLQELVGGVSALIAAQAVMKSIAIEFKCSAAKTLVHCDPNQIKQVIINFLKNSIEAMNQEGLIVLELTADPAEDQIVLRIVDQGCGIPEEQLSRLGEPFFTTKEGGTGLGLMVSRRIIEHHGGRLSITSQVNVGTTVEVRFPVPKDNLVESTAVGI